MLKLSYRGIGTSWTVGCGRVVKTQYRGLDVVRVMGVGIPIAGESIPHAPLAVLNRFPSAERSYSVEPQRPH